jgi:folate-binding protein YgfZ
VKSTVSEEEFTLFRLKHNIPLQGVDYKDDFLLNVSVSRHVSFTKGCYLGQEPISKVNSRSRPSRRLAVRIESKCTPEEKAAMTSKVKDPESGEMMGFVFVDNK